jgi:hypothetical protein
MAAMTRNRYFAGLSRNTILLALSSLFGDVSTEMLVPILPIFLTQTLKASGSVIGVVEGVAWATQVHHTRAFRSAVGQAAKEKVDCPATAER